MGRLNEEWNLRWNPFRGLTPEEWGVVSCVDVAPLIHHLKGAGKAIQFIGDMGRGKTTHIRTLHLYFQGAPFVYLHDRQQDPKPLPKIPMDQMCFIDESQRMSWWSRFRHFRAWRCLVLATHRDHRIELERCGFEVQTIDIHQRDPNQIKLILSRRIEFARRENGPIPQIHPSFFESLYTRYGDNLRGMEDELYEVYMDIETSIKRRKLIWET